MNRKKLYLTFGCSFLGSSAMPTGCPCVSALHLFQQFCKCATVTLSITNRHSPPAHAAIGLSGLRRVTSINHDTSTKFLQSASVADNTCDHDYPETNQIPDLKGFQAILDKAMLLASVS